VDKVVTENCKEIWNCALDCVAHDQIWKWVLQTRYRNFIFYNRETKPSDISE